jgi:GntR family transcriptional regulator
MKLNPQSPIPLYRQLADFLLSKIRAGDYPPGTPIPSEHSLAREFSIGRPTARQATDWLVRRRILVRKRGSGTYVRTDQHEIDLFSLAGTLSAFQRSGISVVSRILTPTRLIDVPADPDNPFAERSAFFFSRLSSVGSVPVLLEEIFLEPGVFQAIDGIDLKDRSLSQIVEDSYHLRPTGGRQTFRIGYLDGEKAEHMAVAPTTPILEVKRFLNFEPAANAVFSELFCRTDQFVFSQTIGDVSDE